jgi:hypothetical protein
MNKLKTLPLDAIELRRTRNKAGQFKKHDKAYIKMEMPRGQFILFDKTINAIGLKHKDAVMFAFSRTAMAGYIWKEEPQDDSYIVQNSERNYFRFTSKDLMLYFTEAFKLNQITTKSNVYFVVNTQPDQAGRFTFKLE